MEDSGVMNEKPTKNEGENNTSSSPEHVKLFFDGACDSKNGIVGLGAMLLGDSGVLLGALAIPLRAGLKPHIVEALAPWRNLIKFGKYIGAIKLAIVGDSVGVISTIGRNGLDLSDIRGIMDAALKVKTEFEWVTWKHVRKCNNHVAHTLARSALKMVQAMYCYESGSSWLQYVLDANTGN